MADFVESSNPDFPLKITTKAAAKLIWALASEDDLGPEGFVRVAVQGGGCSGYQHLLSFSDEFDPEEDVSTTIKNPGLQVEGQPDSMKVVADTFSALYLAGVELDFVSEQFKEGFRFDGGTIKGHCGCGSSVRY